MDYLNNKKNFSAENQLKKDKDFIVERQKVLDEEKKNRVENYDQIQMYGDEVKKDSSSFDKIFNLVGNLSQKLNFFEVKPEPEEVIKTNLIQDEASSFIEWGAYFKILVKYVISSLVVSGIIFLTLLLWQQKVRQYGQGIDENIFKLDQVIASEESEIEGIKKFSNKIELVNFLLDNHVRWTNFFKFLEKNTIANINYAGSFSGNTGGSYNMQSTADSYGAMAAQIKLLRGKDEVLRVSSDSARTMEKDAGSGIVFNIGIKIKNDIFKKYDYNPE